MDRNKLTERLLGLEIDIRFVSIREAAEAGITGDPVAVESALHCPILLAIDGERDLGVLANSLRTALLGMGANQGVGKLMSLFFEKNMSREAFMDHAWNVLYRVLPPYCAAHGCWLEIQNRRGTGIVGILMRNEREGTDWQKVEWIYDLDGESAIDAWQTIIEHEDVDI